MGRFLAGDAGLGLPIYNGGNGGYRIWPTPTPTPTPTSTPTPTATPKPAPSPSPTPTNGGDVTVMPFPIRSVSCAPGYIYKGTFPTGRCVWMGPGPEPGTETAPPTIPPSATPLPVIGPPATPENGAAAPAVFERAVAWGEQEWIAGLKNKWLALAAVGALLLWQTGKEKK